MKRHHGFTLLELMVVVTIIGIIAIEGLPPMLQWLANVHIRNGADGLQNGVRLAQIEAIRRNSTVTFLVTNADPPLASSTAVSTGRNWALVDSTGALIQAKGAESGGSLVQTPSPAAFTGTIVFNSLGGNNLTSNLQLTFTRTAAAVKPGDHPIAVFLTPAGRVRLCDPARSLGVGDPEACE